MWKSLKNYLTFCVTSSPPPSISPELPASSHKWFCWGMLIHSAGSSKANLAYTFFSSHRLSLFIQCAIMCNTIEKLFFSQYFCLLAVCCYYLGSLTPLLFDRLTRWILNICHHCLTSSKNIQTPSEFLSETRFCIFCFIFTRKYFYFYVPFFGSYIHLYLIAYHSNTCSDDNN